MHERFKETRALIVRADATRAIGSGHIMRCAALSQVFFEQRWKVTFLSFCESPDLTRRILDFGFSMVPIESPWPASTDLEQTLSVLEGAHRSGRDTPWLLLDGYHFDLSYQEAIFEEGFSLAVIDDIGHLAHYPADILINPNIYAERIFYPHKNGTVLLLGGSYALLRKQFLKWREWERAISENARKMLVTMGGSDSRNATSMVIDALSHLTDPGIEVRIVVGPSNARADAYRTAVSALPIKAEIIASPDDMPELMAWADLAVTAGGTTCTEMCFMGLPSLVMVVAENQKRVAEEMDRKGCSMNLGPLERVSPEILSSAVKDLIRDRERRKGMSVAGRKLIDGFGTNRVYELILKRSCAGGERT